MRMKSCKLEGNKMIEHPIFKELSDLLFKYKEDLFQLEDLDEGIQVVMKREMEYATELYKLELKRIRSLT